LVLWIGRTEICCRKASLANLKELSIRTGRTRWDVKSDTGRERQTERKREKEVHLTAEMSSSPHDRSKSGR